jgi:TP901 family phage tail tape measure protein
MVVAGGLGAAAFGLAVHSAADLEHTISGVGAVSGATAPQLQQLSRLAVQLGQDTTLSGVGASDAAKAMEELAKGGVSVSDIMGGAARGALLLASAGEVEVGRAAEIAADAMNQFGLSGKDVPHIADLLAAAANASSLEVNDLALSLKYVGPVAHSMGISLEETVAALAELGAAGIKADTAGTGIRTMMVNLANPTKAMRKIMAEYGLSFFDAAGHMKNLEGVAGELHSKLAGLTDQQRLQALETLFGKEALSGAIVVYDRGAEGITTGVRRSNVAGSAAEVGSAGTRTSKAPGPSSRTPPRRWRSRSGSSSSRRSPTWSTTRSRC